ncbi:hypothetical protein [Nocardia gipuzkoensis]
MRESPWGDPVHPPGGAVRGFTLFIEVIEGLDEKLRAAELMQAGGEASSAAAIAQLLDALEDARLVAECEIRRKERWRLLRRIAEVIRAYADKGPGKII